MMTDDLAKQLRLAANLIENGEKIPPRMDILFMRKAAERIDELDDTIKGLRHMIIDQIEGAGDDPEIMAASRAEWAARALAAEAKIKEARFTYSGLVNQWSDPFEDDDGSDETWRQYVSNALKQLRDILEGDSDEQTTDSNDY
jgi:hypothetical protein